MPGGLGRRGLRILTSRVVLAVTLPLGATVSLVAAASPAGASTPPVGSLLAWGANNNGQLGNGNTTQANTPVTASLPAGTSVVSLGAHHFASYAITSTGTVLAWGDGTDGDLGDNSTANNEVPMPVSLPNGTIATSVAAGHDFALAATSTGAVYAWGNNSDGELGMNPLTTSSSSVPVAVQLPSGTDVTAVAAGGDTSYALTSSGEIYAWGDNTYGELGDGSSGSNTSTYVPGNVQLQSEVATSIAADSEDALALTASGQVYAWGDNSDGQLGDGTSTGPEMCDGNDPCSTAPVAVSLPTGVTATAVAAGHYHSLALTSTGGIYAWGDNTAGELGDGEFGNGMTTYSDVPVAVKLPTGVTATAVAGGSEHSLALTSTGKIYAWGFNKEGQLGDNSTTSSDVPVAVKLPTGVTATAVAAGDYYSLALLAPPSASVSPGAGPAAGGTPVTITGSNFSAVSAVDFGSVPAKSFKLVTSSEIIAVSPPHAEGAVQVTVTTPNGTSTASLATRFTFATTIPTEPPLPATAGTTPRARLESVSCTSATSCVAVGEYGEAAKASHPEITSTGERGGRSNRHTPRTIARGGGSYGLIETLSGGTWHALQAPEPAGAGTLAENEQIAYLDSVSCPAPGVCVAVGGYADADGYEYGLIDTLAGGTWTAVVAPEPANNAGTDAGESQYAELDAVTCTSSTACTTVGDYEDTNRYYYGLIDTLAGGTWKATPAPDPANSGTDGDGEQYAFLYALSCPSAGNCAAVGDYEDTSGYEYGLIETLASGAWTATGAPEPANAGSDADDTQYASLNAISCASASSCTAVGSYDDTNRYSYGLIDTLSSGNWVATKAPEPHNAGTDADETQNASLELVSCTASTTCHAVGNYDDTTGARHGLIETLSGTTWTDIVAPEPANAGPAIRAELQALAKASSGGEGLWCGGAGSCTYVSSYADTTQYSYPLIDTLASDAWDAAEGPEPADAGSDATATASGNLESVTCTKGGTCYSVGSYEDDNGDTQALIEVSAIAAVSAASTVAACDQVSLSWTNPDNPDLGGVYIQRSTTEPPATDADGTRVANVLTPGQSYTDAHLVAGTTYYYGLFAHDGNGLVVAGGVDVSAKPVCKSSSIVNVVDDASTHKPWGATHPAGTSAYDTASVRGVAGLTAPTGTVSYSFFHGGSCSGSAIRSVVKISGGVVPASPTTGPLAVGEYSFRASYGGDSIYSGSASACEPFIVAVVAQSGYYLEGGDGGVFAFHRGFYGSLPPPSLGLHVYDIVAMATATDGYWLVGRNGAVYAFGGVHFYGSLASIGIHTGNIVGVAATPDGRGYWLVSADGGIYTFGDASYHGSCPASGSECHGVADVVGIAAADAGGYWLVAANGNVYSFGDATDHGACANSDSGCQGIADIVAITGHGAGGYWLASSDGGVFAFGDAPYHGSCPQAGSSCQGVRDVVGIASPDLGGYWLAEADGNVLGFGDARVVGRCGTAGTGCVPLVRPIVAIS
jgi:alpha-tubulin suppressor-like RCC1 family protein